MGLIKNLGRGVKYNLFCPEKEYVYDPANGSGYESLGMEAAGAINLTTGAGIGTLIGGFPIGTFTGALVGVGYSLTRMSLD